MPAVWPYLAGLSLDGRRVVLVGGGRVAARRFRALLEAGASLEVISPSVHPAVAGQADRDALVWRRRPYRTGDLGGAWYAIAATDDPVVNAQVVADADQARVFCVRADAGSRGSAVTPAAGRVDGLQVAVLASGDHRRSRAVRDRLLGLLRSSEASGTDGPGSP